MSLSQKNTPIIYINFITESSIEEEISVMFQANDIGQYEMPIMFTFVRMRDNKNLIIIREMVGSINAFA